MNEEGRLTYLHTNERVFYPTEEEFSDFRLFVRKIEEECSEEGYAVIEPPLKWREQLNSVDTLPRDFSINPVFQRASEIAPGFYILRAVNASEVIDSGEKKRKNKGGKIGKCSVLKDTMTVGEYIDYVHNSSSSSQIHDIDTQERKYWKEIESGFAVYGADIDYTFFGPNVKEWNFNNLPGILNMVKTSNGNIIKGIHTPYTYIGSYKSSFGFHVEDLNLYSINYHINGAPKIWYIIPRSHGIAFEKTCQEILANHCGSECENLLRHKIAMCNDTFFMDNKIQRTKIVQQPSQIIITFPYIYHGGWNSGLNYNIAVNFALPAWVKYGKHAKQCSCTDEEVSCHMDLNVGKVVKRFHRSTYPAWKDGNDIKGNPDDPVIMMALEQRKREITMRNFIKLKENAEKQILNAKLDPKILSLFAHFLAQTNCLPKSVKIITAFKKRHPPTTINLPPLKPTTFLSRLEAQLYEPLRRGKDSFGLSKTELKRVLDKIRSKRKNNLQ